MIVDSLNNAERYLTLHPHFAKAFTFLQSSDASNLASGKHELLGEELFAIVDRPVGVGKKKAKREAHRKYIDIQYCCSGTDVYWLGRSSKLRHVRDWLRRETRMRAF